MSEQSALSVGDATFCRADATATVEDVAIGPDLARLQRDGSDERNLELKRCTANAYFERRLDGQARAAIEKSRREAAVHRAPCRGHLTARWQREPPETCSQAARACAKRKWRYHHSHAPLPAALDAR